MKAIFLSVIWPTAYFALSYMLGTEHLVPKPEGKKKQKEAAAERRKIVRRLLAVFAAELSVFVILGILSQFFMFNTGEDIPMYVTAIAAIVPFAAVLAPYLTSNDKICRFLKRSAVITFALLTAEVVLFNMKSFTRGDLDVKLKDGVTIDGSASMTGSSVSISGDTRIFLNEVPEGTKGIIVDTVQKRRESSRSFFAVLSMQDDNFARTYEITQQKFNMGYGRPLTFAIEPYGKIRSLRLSIEQVTSPITIKSIRAVSALPFEFSAIRFFVLLAVGVLLAAVKELQLYRVKFSFRKRSHLLLAELMAMVCAMSAVLFLEPKQEMVKYEGDATHYTADPFAMTFDALKKKQVYLDFKAEDGLLDIENVYEWTQRTESNTFYLWDYAYYDHKYYCYFGIAPVLTFYFPTYWITGHLPTLQQSVVFFTVLAIFFFCQVIIEGVRLIAPKANLLLVLASMPAAAASLGVYYVLNLASMYYLPLAAGMCFLSLTLWLGMRACSTKKPIPRMIKLFFGGVSMALAVGSRPGMALGAALLIPLFLGILFNKKQKLAYRIGQAACFVVPMVIGGIGLMWYNNARFGSPFDFGASYQLTVSDIHANKIHAAGFMPMLYHYIFQYPRPRCTFPFFEPQFYYLGNYGSYAYIADAVGALSFPLVLLGTVMLPVGFSQKKGRRFSHGITALQRKAVIALCFIMALFIGWQDYCLGGVIRRYVVDIMPLFVFGSLLILFRINADPKKHKYRYIVTGAALAATFVFGWLLAAEERDCHFARTNPLVYDALEDLIIFWR